MPRRGAHLSAARAHEGPCLLSRGPSEKEKTRLREWFGFALTFALFARDRRAPHLARSRKFPKKNRPRELEATFERKRDTRDFAHFSHLNRLNIKVAPDFSFFFVTAPVRKPVSSNQFLHMKHYEHRCVGDAKCLTCQSLTQAIMSNVILVGCLGKDTVFTQVVHRPPQERAAARERSQAASRVPRRRLRVH